MGKIFLANFRRTTNFPVHFPKASAIVILKFILLSLIIFIALLLQNFVRTSINNYTETKDKISLDCEFAEWHHHLWLIVKGSQWK